MFKYLLALTLAFSFMSFANADSIPDVVDPKNEVAVWTRTVYNGSGAAIASAQVVRWDCGAVDQDAGFDDMCMWVEETDVIGTASVEKVAGVVPYGRPLAAGAIGDIIVDGPAIVYHGSNTVTDAYLVQPTAAGEIANEDSAGSNEYIVGWCIDNDASTEYSHLASTYSIIFVRPQAYHED